MSSRFLLAVTEPNTHLSKTLSMMATVAGLESKVFGAASEALAWLDAHEPHAVVVDLRQAGVNDVCRRVRGRRELCQVPVVALTPELSDGEAARFIASGVDEVLPLDARAQLLVRLQALPTGSLRPPKRQGVVIIADPEPLRCDIFGRLFSNAGYDIQYAVDDRSVAFYDKESAANVVLLSPRLADPLATIKEARSAGSRAVWVVTAPRRDLGTLTGRLRNLTGVAVIARDAPPTDALFFANELLQKGAKHRKKPRKLFGTQVRFKPEGASEDDYGFSYNVSEEGIYVRTLAPPRADTVWLQVRPPLSDKWVCLEARVAWRRKFDAGVTAAVPPGFGARFVAGLGGSLGEWQRAVSRFARVTPKHSVSLATLVSQTLEDEGVDSVGLDEPIAESVPLWGAEDGEPNTLDGMLCVVPRPTPKQQLMEFRPPGAASALAVELADSREAVELDADELDTADLLSVPPDADEEVSESKQVAPIELADLGEEAELDTADLLSVPPEPAEDVSGHMAPALPSRRAGAGLSEPPLSSAPDTVRSTPAAHAGTRPEEPTPKLVDSSSGITSALITDVPPPPERSRSRAVWFAATAVVSCVGLGGFLASVDDSGTSSARAGQAVAHAAVPAAVASVPPNKPALSDTRAPARRGSQQSSSESPTSNQSASAPGTAPGIHAEGSAEARARGAKKGPASDTPAPTTDYDDADLIATQGGLVVNGVSGLRVVVQGVDRGFVGQRLVVPCGYKHVRLRAEDLSAWRSEGQPVMVKCGSTTVVNVESGE